ncbi:hypothetical protein Tco_0252218 [Tanacetum coccineum]
MMHYGILEPLTRLYWMYPPYKFVYGKSVSLTVELDTKAYWALKHRQLRFKTAGVSSNASGNGTLSELRVNVTRTHFSERSSPVGSGPFTISEVYPYGTAKLSHVMVLISKAIVPRLKHLLWRG